MKVAFIHPDLGVGGAERLVVDAACGLVAKGHSVHIYTSHHDASHCFKETVDGTLAVTVHGDFLPRHLFGRFHIVFAILRSLWLALVLLLTKRCAFDVLFCDQVSFNIPILRLMRAKIFFYCHFPDKLLANPGSFLKKLYRAPVDFLEGATTAMADCIVVNSQFTARVFRSAFPRIKTVPSVLYPAINFSKYQPPSTPPPGFLSDGHTLLSINRFERKKNIGLAIEAFALLLKDRQALGKLRLVVAGGYDPRVAENVEHLEELRQLADRLGLAHATWTTTTGAADGTAGSQQAIAGSHQAIAGSHQAIAGSHQAIASADVVFLASFSEAQRAWLLHAAAALVYTPASEHFGIVPVEAMYAGVPVLACNTGGPLETVKTGITGYLCEPTAAVFASALRKLLTTKNSKETMGRQGRIHVEENFSLEAFSNRLERMLQELVSGTH